MKTRTKLILFAIVLIGMAFAWWTISPLFIDKVVEDQLSPELKTLIESMPTETVAPSRPVILTISESGESMIMPVETSTSEDTAPRPAADAPKIMGPFTIEDTTGHPATGAVRVISTNGEQLIRYEGYEGTNGPDLYVYLAKDLEAEEFVSLGRAKGNQGNINYEVPSEIDISEYKYVMTWCRAFGVLFDYAEIN